MVYKMPKEMAINLLKTRKNEEKKMSDQDFLKKIVNEQLRLKDVCERVILY